MEDSKTVATTLRLSAELKETLQEMAKEDRRSMNNMLTSTLETIAARYKNSKANENAGISQYGKVFYRVLETAEAINRSIRDVNCYIEDIRDELGDVENTPALEEVKDMIEDISGTAYELECDFADIYGKIEEIKANIKIKR